MKNDFTRTPDGSQRIVDANLKVLKALAIPLFTDSPDLNDNPDEAGYIRYHAGIIEVYNGTTWASQTLPAGGTNLQYLRGDKTWQTLNTLSVPENTNLYYTDGRVQTYSDARYLQLSGGVLTGDVQNATLPVNANSYITRGYLEGYLTGITWKQEVKAATTANITLSGTQTVDGVAMIANDRILIKNQAIQTDNGIYIVQSGAWIRSTDADTSAEIGSATVLVRNGTVNKNTQWTCTNTVDPVIGTDNITFGQISGAGTYVNGTGITLTGNAFSLDLTFADVRYQAKGNYINNQNVTPQTGDFNITGSATSSTQSLSSGGHISTNYLGTIGGIAGQLIFGSDAGYYAFQSSTANTASRLYILPNGSPTGTTAKFEIFADDYVSSTSNYRGFNAIVDNVSNTIQLGANIASGASNPRLQMILGGYYVGSVLQSASPTIKFNIDNTLEIYGATTAIKSAGRINFTVNTSTDIGNWNSNGLGIGDNTQTYLYPLDIIKTTTGGTVARVKNPTAGTGNYGRFIVECDVSNSLVFTAFSSTFTTSGINIASSGALTGGASGGLSIGAINAAGILRFYSGGNAAANVRITIDATGLATFTNKVNFNSDIEVVTSGTGIILKDTGDGSRRRITSVNGVLTVSAAL